MHHNYSFLYQWRQCSSSFFALFPISFLFPTFQLSHARSQVCLGSVAKVCASEGRRGNYESVLRERTPVVGQADEASVVANPPGQRGFCPHRGSFCTMAHACWPQQLPWTWLLLDFVALVTRGMWQHSEMRWEWFCQEAQMAFTLKPWQLQPHWNYPATCATDCKTSARYLDWGRPRSGLGTWKRQDKTS